MSKGNILDLLIKSNEGKEMVLTIIPSGKSGNVKLVRFDKSNVMFENLSETFKSFELKHHIAPDLCKGSESCFWLPIDLMVTQCKLELV